MDKVIVRESALLAGVTGVTILAGALLTVPTTNSDTAQATVTVLPTCSMTATVNSAHSITLVNGQYNTAIGKTTLKTICNDQNGYAIYASGYTGGSTGTGSNVLTDGVRSITSTATHLDGTASDWAMKVTAVKGTYAPEILNGFANLSAVPTSYTEVAKFTSMTDVKSPATGSSVETTYAASVAPNQVAGVYTGQVKYALVHPNNAPQAQVTFDDAFVAAGKTKSGDYYVMQDMTASICSAVSPAYSIAGIEAQTTTLIDTRDNNTYTVAKLPDGNCWMTQNLDLLLSQTTALTSENTNLETNYGTSAGYTTEGDVLKWTPGTVLSTGTVTSTTAVTGWNNSTTAPRQAEGLVGYMYKGTYYDTLAGCAAAAGSEANCASYEIGNYYNWTAAVAMSSTNGYSGNYTTLNNSICPAGWRLPKGLTENGGAVSPSEYNKLLFASSITNGTDITGGQNTGWSANGFNRFESLPFAFARSGYVHGSSLYYFRSNAYYWSSTVNSSDYSYHLYYNSSNVYPADRYYRNYGFSVRCLAQ